MLSYRNARLNVDEIHGKLQKFSPKNDSDISNAEILQDFFQGIKRYIKGERNITLGGVIQDAMLEELIQSIDEVGKRSHSNYNVNNLFQKRGGTRFEYEVERVFLGLINNAFKNLENTPLQKTFITGNVQGSALADITTSDISSNFAKKLSDDLKISVSQANIIDFIKAGKLNRNVKIDVDFTTLNGNIIVEYTNEYLNIIFNLLRDATFTAKNYDSKRIVGIVDQELILEDASNNTISLGDTYWLKAIYGSLRFLGYPKSVAISHAFRTHYSENTDLTIHAYHLRSMYELTGAGIVYKGEQSLGRIAKYIIYNDPSGGIYVKSTAGIIKDMLNNNSPFVGKKTIAITKEYFY